MVTNPNAFSQQGTGNTLNQIVDGADFPHTGLIKSLSQGIQGNYVISGFDITMGGNTAGTVADGVIMFEGQRKAITLGSSNSFTLTTSTGVNLYHLLVITDTGTLALRNQQAGSTITADKVADVTSGDTIIAVVSSQNGGSNAAQVQYLTTDKKSNSLSIARKNGTTYTEGLTIQSNAGDIEIEAKESDKDIIFKVDDGGTPTEVMRIDGALSSIRIGQSTSSATDGPDAKLDVRGANDNSISIMGSGALSIENSAEQISPSSRAYAFLSVDNGRSMVGGNIRLDDSITGGTHAGYADGTDQRGGAGIIFTNSTTNDDGEIQFVRQNDSNDDTWTVKESMIIKNNGRVGIGTNTPTETLDVNGTIKVSGGLQVSSGGTFRSTRLLTVSISTATTLTEASHAGRYLLCSANVTLPSTSSEGEHYTILNTSSGNITIGRNGNNINGAGSDATVSTYNGATCIAIGSNDWIVLGV